MFLSHTLIVDTLKYWALKLSLLSTESDIASLSLLRTNFVYSFGRFFFISFKFIFVLFNFILVSFCLPFMQVVDSFRDKRWFAWRCGP